MKRKPLSLIAFPILALLVANLACNIGTVEPSPEPEQAMQSQPEPTLDDASSDSQAQPVPTEESSSIEPGQPVKDRFYTQDFDEPLHNWSYVLTSGDADYLSLDVVDGYLVFDLKSKDLWTHALYDEFEYTDVRIDVRVENVRSKNSQINIICRYDERDGWWELNVSNVGLYQIRYGKWDNNMTTASYTRIADGGSNFYKTGHEVNDIGFSCVENEIALYINGHEIRKARDDLHALRKGQIGVGVSSLNDPDVNVQYDWVKISEP